MYELRDQPTAAASETTLVVTTTPSYHGAVMVVQRRSPSAGDHYRMGLRQGEAFRVQNERLHEGMMELCGLPTEGRLAPRAAGPSS